MSGKRFSKSCQKKVPQDFQAPKLRKQFQCQMDENKKHPSFPAAGFAGSPGNNEDETPFGQSRNLICTATNAAETAVASKPSSPCYLRWWAMCALPTRIAAASQHVGSQKDSNFCWSLEGVARFFLDLKKRPVNINHLKMKMWTSIGITSLYSNLICNFRLFWTCNLNHNGNLETTEAQSRFSASRERQLPSMCLVRVAQHGCEPLGHRRDSWFMGVLQYVFFHCELLSWDLRFFFAFLSWPI